MTPKPTILSKQWKILTVLKINVMFVPVTVAHCDCSMTHYSTPIFREAKGEKTLKLAVQEPCLQHCRAAVTLIVLFILSARRSEKDQVSVTLYF